jgi:hypothetical protein
MFAVYGDASGAEADEKATVVACFLNSVKNSIDFDERWRAMLEKHQVPYLHMREFAHSIGPFAKWKGNEPARREFLAEALNIIETTGCVSFSALVDSEAFRQFEIKHRGDHSLIGGYPFAARTCLSSISGWCRDRRLAEPVEYVLERGDTNQNVLPTIAKVDGLPEPIFRSKTAEDPERSTLPLQASDLLAYELLKGYRDIGKGTLRYTLRELERMTHDWGIYDGGNIDSLVPVSDAVRAIEAIAKTRARESETE